MAIEQVAYIPKSEWAKARKPSRMEPLPETKEFTALITNGNAISGKTFQLEFSAESVKKAAFKHFPSSAADFIKKLLRSRGLKGKVAERRGTTFYIAIQ